MSINYIATGKISAFLKNNKRPLLVLLGPTASGKTALSLEIAKKFNCEIISADSRQVYKYMDIGTDKIPMEKRCGIPHHLIDVVEPDVRFTVADFKKLAEEKIEEIHARGAVPFLVGGTGLYIRAITENFAIPAENPVIRAQIMKELEEHGALALHEKLKKLDPVNAEKIHPNNIPYVVRALEIFAATGKPKNAEKKSPKYSCLVLGINPFEPNEEKQLKLKRSQTSPRWKTLFEKIDMRVDEQISRGLVDETKKLLQMGFAKDLRSMNSLGYSEMIKYLEGELSLEEATKLLKHNTRCFAKRQMVWFKKDKLIFWL